MPERSAIDSLLNQWSEEVIPESEPHVALRDGDIYKNIENAQQLLSTRRSSPILFYEDSSSLQSEFKATPSTDLEYAESNSTDTAYVSDNSSQHFDNNYGLLPVDEGFIVVEDVEIAGNYSVTFFHQLIFFFKYKSLFFQKCTNPAKSNRKLEKLKRT